MSDNDTPDPYAPPSSPVETVTAKPGHATSAPPVGEPQAERAREARVRELFAKAEGDGSAGSVPSAPSIFDAAQSFVFAASLADTVPRPCKADLDRIATALERHHLALVSCWDEQVVSSAVNMLVREGVLAGCQDIRLVSQDPLGELPIPGISLADLVLAPGKDVVETTIVLAFVEGEYPDEARQLVATLTDLALLADGLRSSGRRLLALLSPDAVEALPRLADDAVTQDVVIEIDYLPPLLRAARPAKLGEALNIDEVHRTVVHQIEAGLWGGSPREVRDRIAGDFVDGKLIDEITRKAKTPLSSAGADFDKALKQAVEPVEKGTEPDATLLFTTAFFPNLGLRDYEDVFVRLIGDRGESAIEKTETLAEDGTLRQVGVRVQRYYRDLYRENPARHRCQAGLIIDTSGAHPTIAFNVRYLTHPIQRYFQSDGIDAFNRYFDQGCKAKLLFHPSEVIASHFMRVAVAAARLDTPVRSGEWLIRLIDGTDDETGILNDGTPKADSIERFIEDWNTAKLEEHKRITKLLQMFCEDPQLAAVVRGLIDTAIRRGRIELALQLILLIFFNREIDPYEPLRRIVESQSRPNKIRIMEMIRPRMRSSGPALAEHLVRLGGWLPDDKRGWEQYSDAQKLACREIIHVLLLATYQFDVNRYGNAVGHPIVAACCDTTGRRSGIISVLKHPGLRFYLDHVAENEAQFGNSDVQDLYAFLAKCILLACRRAGSNKDLYQSVQNFAKFIEFYADVIADEDDERSELLVGAYADINRVGRHLHAWLLAEWYVMANGLDPGMPAPTGYRFTIFLNEFATAMDRGERRALLDGLSELRQLLSAVREHEIVKNGNRITRPAKFFGTKAKSILQLHSWLRANGT